MCGTLSPHLGQTHWPPGPAADGPPILPHPPPPAPRPPPPRPEPIPKPLGMTLPPCRRRHPWQPGITNVRLASSPFKKAPNTSSTVPHVKPITRTPAETNRASMGAEIAPQITVSTPRFGDFLRPRERICPAQLPLLAPDLLPGLDIDHQQVAGGIEYRRDATLPARDCDSHQPKVRQGTGQSLYLPQTADNRRVIMDKMAMQSAKSLAKSACKSQEM